MTTNDTTLYPTSVSVDQDGKGRVVLTAYDHSTATADDVLGHVTRFVIEPGAALVLLRDLAGHATSSVERAVVHVKSGDCGRCRNTRLVDVVLPGNRMSKERCPECAPAYNAAIRDPWARPRVGGGVS